MPHRINVRVVLALALTVLVIAGCGAATKINYKQVYSEIQSAQKSNDIVKLMEIYSEYPEYEEYLSNYLTNLQDYSKFSYLDLRSFVEIAKRSEIPQLYEDMQFVRTVREQEIESTVAKMDISSMGQYYHSHTDEQHYLDSLFVTSLGPILNDADYVTLRQVHNAFVSTPLGDYADQYYTPLREVLMESLSESMEEYFQYELETLEAVKNQSVEEFDVYLQGVVDNIVKYCFNNKLAWIKKNVNDQADRIVSSFFDTKLAGQIFESNVDNYSREVKYSRDAYLSQLLHGVDNAEKAAEPLPKDSKAINLYPYADYAAFMNLRNAQRKIDWFGVGLTAASFAVAWPAGILVDIADVAYSTYSDKEKEKAIAEEFNNFIPSVYTCLLDNNMINIDSYFRRVELELRQSQNNLKDYVEKVF